MSPPILVASPKSSKKSESSKGSKGKAHRSNTVHIKTVRKHFAGEFSNCIVADMKDNLLNNQDIIKEATENSFKTDTD